MRFCVILFAVLCLCFVVVVTKANHNPPLIDALIFDTVQERLSWISNEAVVPEQNVTLSFGTQSRSALSFQGIEPKRPVALAVGTRLITTNGSGLCEFDMNQQGALVRFLPLAESPSDLVFLPQVPQHTAQVLLVMPLSHRIGAIDYQTFEYIGTWAMLDINSGNVSIEYDSLTDSVLLAIESEDSVFRYSRIGVNNGVWLSVPRPRYLSVLPLADLTFVLSAEADVCELYTFQTSDGTSLGVSGSSNWCDKRKERFSFGIQVDQAYALNINGALESFSVYNGAMREAHPQMTIGPLKALTRSDASTGSIGLLDSYAWRNSVEDQPQPINACGSMSSGATLSRSTLAIYTCNSNLTDRLIVADTQSIYSLYRTNHSAPWCFERHFYIGNDINTVRYNALQDTLYLLAPANKKLVGLCADELEIVPQPLSQNDTLTCENVTWCDGSFAWNGSTIWANGTAVRIIEEDSNVKPLLLSLSTSNEQLFAVFRLAVNGSYALRWLHPLDQNFTVARWVDSGVFQHDAAPGTVLFTVHAYPEERPAAVAPPPPSNHRGSAWPWILIGCLLGLVMLACVVFIVVVAVRRRRYKERQYGGSGHQLATDWSRPSSNLAYDSGDRSNSNEKELPCSNLRKLIRSVFCYSSCCYESRPPGRLRFCYCCLGGIRKQSVQPYQQLNELKPPEAPLAMGGANDQLGSEEKEDNGVPPGLPPRPSSRYPSVVVMTTTTTPAPAATAAANHNNLPEARGDSFTGTSPFTEVDINKPITTTTQYKGN